MAHEVALVGYSAESESYERGRPGYPAHLVDRLLDVLGVDKDARVLDVGAGTGKLTRQIVPRVAWVGAVEPVSAMRDQLRRHVPQAVQVAGVAEAMPFATGSVDAVLCAQTFHWLDGPHALAEFARVLRPGGGVGLIWNTKDENVEWVAEVEALVDEVHGPSTTPRYKTGRWRSAFQGRSGWQPLSTSAGTYNQPSTGDDVVARVLSSSAVGALDPKGRERVTNAVREILKRHDLHGSFDFPYLTEIWWTKPEGRP